METSSVAASPGSRSYENENNNESHRQAADPARQEARAAPNTANVQLMFNNTNDAPPVEFNSSQAGPITYGENTSGDNESQRQARQAAASQDEPYYRSGPSREEVKAAARGQQGQINFGGQEPVRISTNRYEDGNVTIERGSANDPDDPSKQSEHVLLSTGDGDDRVHVERGRDGGLVAHVNGRSYHLPFQNNSADQQRLYIDTAGGRDGVSLDYGGREQTFVNLGAGNDIFYGGAGRTNVFGGDGSDIINLGSGDSYAEGNDGNDFITGGTGNTVIYGGKGSDELRAGGGPDAKISYLDGGQGNDLIYGGRGRNILHGGGGDDIIYGGDRNVIYTGRGQDTVTTYNPSDIVYGQRGVDNFNGVRSPASVRHLDASSNGGSIKIEGSENFIQNMEDNLEFLRSSPTGQGMLAEIDSLAAPITLREGLNGSSYHHRDPDSPPSPQDANRLENDPAYGFISNGVRGAPATNPVLIHERSFITPGHGRPPAVILFHELSHAVNGGQGTFLPGYTFVGHPDPNFAWERNLERQAVGLPTSHQPFQFLGRNFSASTYNPWPYNENALLAELNLPLRQRYFD